LSQEFVDLLLLEVQHDSLPRTQERRLAEGLASFSGKVNDDGNCDCFEHLIDIKHK
jgi:hypothetical protein